MKKTYTIEELYAAMYSNNLQGERFEDALIALSKMEKSSAELPKDPSPMIGLNPFKSIKSENVLDEKSSGEKWNRFFDILNYRVAKYQQKEKAAD